MNNLDNGKPSFNDRIREAADIAAERPRPIAGSVVYKECHTDMINALVDGDIIGAIYPMHGLAHHRDAPWNVVVFKISSFHTTLELAKRHIEVTNAAAINAGEKSS